MALASLIVKIGADLTDLNKALDSTDKGVQRFGRKLAGVGQSMTLGLTTPIVAGFALAFKAAEESAQGMAKLNAVLTATGGEAGVTAEHVVELAGRLQKLTTFEDDATIAAAGILLTFKSVRNELGEGNNVFDRTIVAAQDMATIFGGDLQESTIQLAKAIEDPIRGMGALTRVGVTFSDEQRKVITALQESGDKLGAQKIILEALETQFGGTAQAMAETAGGQMTQAFNELGDAAEMVGDMVAPIIEKVADGLKSMASGFGKLSPAQQEMAVQAIAVVAAVGPMLIAFGKVMQFLPLIRLGLVALTGPAGLVVAAVVGLALAWIKWGDDIKRVVGEVVGKVKGWFDSTLGPTIDKVKPMVAALSEAFRSNMEKIGGAVQNAVTIAGDFLRALSPTFDAVKGYVGALWEMFKVSFKLIGAIVEVTVGTIVNVLQAVLGPPLMWLKDNVLPPLGKAFEVFRDLAVGAVRGMVDIAAGLINTFIGGPLKALTGGIEMVTGAFEWMYDQVVGNSFVPDMVREVTAEFVKMEGETTRTTEELRKKVAARFEELRVGATTSTRAMVQQVAADLQRQYDKTVAVFNSLDSTMVGPAAKASAAVSSSYDQMASRAISSMEAQQNAFRRTAQEFEALGGTLEKVSAHAQTTSVPILRGGIAGAFDSIAGAVGKAASSLGGFLEKLTGFDAGGILDKLGLGGGGSGILGKITDAISGLIPGGSIVNAIAGPLINKAVGAVGKGVVSVGKKITGFLGFADGGMHSGGLRIVGERGPELEATGPARIYSHSQTKEMLGGGNDAMVRVSQAGFQALLASQARTNDALYELTRQVSRLQAAA